MHNFYSCDKDDLCKFLETQKTVSMKGSWPNPRDDIEEDWLMPQEQERKPTFDSASSALPNSKNFQTDVKASGAQSRDSFFDELLDSKFEPLSIPLELSRALLPEEESQGRDFIYAEEIDERHVLKGLYALSKFIQKYKFSYTVMHVRHGSAKSIYVSLRPLVVKHSVDYLKKYYKFRAHEMWQSCVEMHGINIENNNAVQHLLKNEKS